VGSAVFNIMFVIGLCGLFGGMVCELSLNEIAERLLVIQLTVYIACFGLFDCKVVNEYRIDLY
jgi:Ca2+/Na+ antiporter